MIVILLASGKLRKLSGRDHLDVFVTGRKRFALTSGVFYTAAASINTGPESQIFSSGRPVPNAVNSFTVF